MKPELNKLINDTITFVNDSCNEWEKTKNESKAKQKAIEVLCNSHSTDKEIIHATYDMIEAFNLQASNAKEILNFMLDDDVAFLLNEE